MQTTNVMTVADMRPVSGYTSEMTSGAVTAVQEIKTSSPDSTIVRLSGESIYKYATDPGDTAIEEKSPENPVKKAGQEAAAKAEGSESGGTDPVAETLERLQKLLKEAQQRLGIAQQQMAQAMAELRNASDESQKMAAMMKVQAAQMLVVSAQGEVLEIHTQINKILEEQQKTAKGTGSGG